MWPCTLPLGTSTPRGGNQSKQKQENFSLGWVEKQSLEKEQVGNRLLIILHVICFFFFVSFSVFFFILWNSGGLGKKYFNTVISKGEANRAGLYHTITLCTDAEMPARQQHH